MILTERWSRLPSGHLTAAVLLRGGALVGDDEGLLLRLNQRGELISEDPLPPPVHGLAASRDGKFAAAVAGNGEIVLFEEGRLLFRRSTGIPATIVLIGGRGDHVLALDDTGQGVFLNSFGREIRRIHIPGGLEHAAMVPRSGEVVAICRDGTLRVHSPWGKPLWSTGIPPVTGPPAVDENGTLILVPALSFGAEAFTVRGEAIGAYDIGESVRSASTNAAGDRILLATTADRLVVLDKEATVLSAETFPVPVERVQMAPAGDHALLLSGAGYAHGISIGETREGPLLEMSGTDAATGRPRQLLRTRLFSPFTFFLQPRLRFSPDSSFLAAGGDRQNVRVLRLDGSEIARRRYAGTLIDVSVLPGGDVRVFGTRAVYSFRPGGSASRPEWSGTAEIVSLSLDEGGRATALSDHGEVLVFSPEPGPPQPFFVLEDAPAEAVAASDAGLAIITKKGQVLFFDSRGECRGHLGPWPSPPRVLAHGEAGCLLAVGRMLLLATADGREIWREHLAQRPRSGACLAGVFAIHDDAGAVHVATPGGILRRAFTAGTGFVVPTPDAGEGPGFLVANGPLLSSVHPDGSPRWRYRVTGDISYVRPSPDGRIAGLVAGFDLHIIPIVKDYDAAGTHVAATGYLEFDHG